LRKESTINKFGSSVAVKIVPTFGWGVSTPQFRCFSTISKELDYSKLNPYYVTGFTDAEGCFLINIVRRSDQKLGYNVNLMFKIKLHLKDKLLLEKIINFFDKIGNITVRKNGSVEYVVSSIKESPWRQEIVINHFDNYPLITQK